MAPVRGRPRITGEPAAENAVRNIVTRSWMHGRLWANDPDCLLARQSRTKLTLPQVQSLATAIALSGGALLFSDDLVHLSPDRVELMSSLLPAIAETASVEDIMRESMPSNMTMRIERKFESWNVIARFNWSGRRRDLAVELPQGRWHVFEFWEQRYYGIHQRQLLLNQVPARGVRLLALRRAAGRPQVVGSTFHYSMGGAEIEGQRYDARRRVLQVDLLPVAKPQGELVLHVPRGFRTREATLDGVTLDPLSAGGTLTAQIAVDSPARLLVVFG
jgi:alpha-galactosidase